MASIASSETQQHDQGQVSSGLSWPSQHPLAWEQQRCTMGEEQQSRMGTLGNPGLAVLSFFVLFVWVLVVASVWNWQPCVQLVVASVWTWQPCVHHEHKETWQVISNKRHCLGKALNETGVNFPVQQRLALSGKGAKARKWAQRRSLPEYLYVSVQQDWQNSDSPSLSVLWSIETWLYGDRTFFFLGSEWAFLARRLSSPT